MDLKRKRSENFNQFRNRIGKQYHRLWQEKPVYCPALKKNVHFTREGWEHISGIKKLRRRSQVYQRITLLRFVRHIISHSGTIQDVRAQKGEVFLAFEAIQNLQKFLLGKEDIQRVKVIIKTKKTGKPIFFSVMSD